MKSIRYYIRALSLKIRERYANFKDFRTDRKFVVFESDDWGAIRVPSKEIHDFLISDGYDLDSRPYERFDGIERDSDIIELSKILKNYTDRRGNHPIFTLNYLSANPDFTRIRANKYQEYIWESIENTYQSYPDSSSVIELVKDGEKAGVFEVQFHGREHFDISMWLRALQMGNSDVINAFDVGMCGIFPKENPSHGNKYMVALRCDSPYLQKIIFEGIEEFKRIWGHKPKSFIAPCYTWPSIIEPDLKSAGIELIQTSRFQRIPNSIKQRVHWTGELNSLGQVYTVRNCAFEPSTSSNHVDIVKNTMKQIRSAFDKGRPAIISTHRINYTSRLSENNAGRSCLMLSKLIEQILTEFPDVEFSTGSEIFKKHEISNI